MKKITLALMAVMLVLGMTQCKKEQPTPTPDPTPDGETVYISMKVDDGGKHIVYPGTGAYVFEDGDKIYVGNNGHYVGTLTYGNGTFSGSITSPSTSDYLHFYFTGGKAPASNPSAGSTTSFTVDISDQSSKLPVLSYGRSHIRYVDGTTAYSCMLENQCGLVEFSTESPGSVTLEIDGMKTTALIDFVKPGITPTDERGSITLYPKPNTTGYIRYAILMPQESVEYPRVFRNGSEGIIIRSSSRVPAVTANMICTYDSGTGYVLLDSEPKKFSINNSGGKVYFSQGNLQYIGSAATPYWKLADNQWDYFGETTGQISNNTNVDRDLFGWATSGYYSNIYYHPYDVDYNIEDPAFYHYGYGPRDPYNTSVVYDLTGDNANCDWGVYNAIRNGGNTPNQWRTLTYDEWYYLLQTRSGARYAKATVNEVDGLIIFPDNNSTSSTVLNNINVGSAAFSGNVITQEQWLRMESGGYVFLPSAGRRRTSIYYNNYQYSYYTGGYYWTASHASTSMTDSWGYASFLDSGNANPKNNQMLGCRYNGFAVRLVKDVQ